MSAQAIKAAGKVAGKAAEGHVLKTGAKRDPELYVCFLEPLLLQSSPSTRLDQFVY
jgi:hypothetical protein